MRRLAVAVTAALALAGAAEARPAADPAAGAAAGRPDASDRATPRRDRAAQRRRGAARRNRSAQRRRGVVRGRVGKVVLGLPPGFAVSPPLASGADARAPATGPDAPAGGGDGPDSPPPPPPPAPPAGTGRSVQARTDDRDPDQLRLVLSRTTVLAGDVKVEFNNAFAQDPHDLLVERAGGSGASYAFPELDPGTVDRRTVALAVGEWRMRCTIPTHAERGMTAALTVTE